MWCGLLRKQTSAAPSKFVQGAGNPLVAGPERGLVFGLLRVFIVSIATFTHLVPVLSIFRRN